MNTAQHTMTDTATSVMVEAESLGRLGYLADPTPPAQRIPSLKDFPATFPVALKRQLRNLLLRQVKARWVMVFENDAYGLLLYDVIQELDVSLDEWARMYAPFTKFGQALLNPARVIV